MTGDKVEGKCGDLLEVVSNAIEEDQNHNLLTTLLCQVLPIFYGSCPVLVNLWVFLSEIESPEFQLVT